MGPVDKAGKPVPEARDLARAFDNAELARRIDALDESYEKLEKGHTERHARFITVVFSCMTTFIGFCALLVTILAWLSKNDAQDAVKELRATVENQVKDSRDATAKATAEMETKVDKATTEMNRKFEALAGEALRKPDLQILWDKGPLNGAHFDVQAQPGSVVQLTGPIFLKNSGNKRTETISARFYSTEDTDPMGDSGPLFVQNWQKVASNDRDYRSSWYLLGVAVTVSEKETWTLQDAFRVQLNTTATNIDCKLLVYYGAENPAEADFTMSVKH